MSTIDRLENISASEFNRDYFQAHKPAIIKNGAGNTKFFKKWSLDFLKSKFADREVRVFHSKSGYYNFNIEGQMVSIQQTFKEAVDCFTSKEKDAKSYYMQQISIHEVFPELLEDLEVPKWNFPTDLINVVNLWVGGAGCVTPLHFDFAHNFLTQISGRKEFTIFSPQDTPFLYASKTGKTHLSQLNLDDIDFQKFPLFRKVNPIKFVVEPGDVLFIPPGWWHHVRSLDACISVNHWWNRLELIHGVGLENFPVQEVVQDISRYLKAGISIDHKGADGEYLLIAAIKYGYTNVIEALLTLGANPNLISEKYYPGKLALTIARDSGNIKIAKLLIEYGAGTNRQEKAAAKMYSN